MIIIMILKIERFILTSAPAAEVQPYERSFNCDGPKSWRQPAPSGEGGDDFPSY